MKHLTKWLMIAAAVATIYNTPTGAADITHKAMSAASTAGEKFSQFVNALT